LLFFFAESLGPEYSETHILDLEITWEESEPRTPLVCILSVGSDPTNQIIALAKVKNIRKMIIYVNFIIIYMNYVIFPNTAIKAVSMGQGQEYHARKMMTECMASGVFFKCTNKIL
jgi:dynein heavy chain, axonemal